VRRCRYLALNGIDFILVREKDLAAEKLIALCHEIRDAVRTANATTGLRTKLLVSGRADMAVAAELDGVHLSSQVDELTPEQVKEVYRQAALPAPWVSVSCHSLAEVRRAREVGASAVLFAPVFGKSLRGEQVAEGVGLDALRLACNQAGPVPVFALGGVSLFDATACLRAGAAGIAAIKLFFGDSQGG
jgi:thiamine-phosphate pyrophosphorylase